jgi:ABC-type antimicrobial peptide transport system permease subunit
MSFFDILGLSLRNLREAKLRAALTTMGVIVGVAVIVTMVSFGLGLQRNTLARFKALDLFNEIRVFGRSLSSLATGLATRRRGDGANDGGPRAGGGNPARDNPPTRVLDDGAVEEIAKIPGVIYVEPTIFFQSYVRSDGRVLQQQVFGATVPNESSRFKQFVAGAMIGSSKAGEAVVTERFTRDFGYGQPADAVGQTVELLAPSKPGSSNSATKEQDEPSNFFGIPLDDNAYDTEEQFQGLLTRSFRISGVLKGDTASSGGGLRGLMQGGDVYVPVEAARDWNREFPDPTKQVALELARKSGALAAGQSEGYDSAVIRVQDPVVLTSVRDRLTSLGFGSFSIVDQIDQIRTIFLIVDSALGLLGGISLLVASFGIANTMIMSIFERTREIGIMKAIGAEDLEIKLIFFIEAAVIGISGGVIGSLVAWGLAAVSNRLAFRFIIKPQGGSFVDFFELPPILWIGAILFAALVSIVAALYPASRAARIDPVKALRHD